MIDTLVSELIKTIYGLCYEGENQKAAAKRALSTLENIPCADSISDISVIFRALAGFGPKPASDIF